MRRLLALAAVSSLLVSTVFAGSSSAHVEKFDTTLRIDKSPNGQVGPGDKVLVFGKLKPSKCRLGQEVTVYEAGPGSDSALGSDNLDGDGEYSVAIHPDSSLRVYAKVGSAVIVSNYQHTHKCKGDRSEKIKINVS